MTDFGVPMRWDVAALEAAIRTSDVEDQTYTMHLLMTAEGEHIHHLREQREQAQKQK